MWKAYIDRSALQLSRPIFTCEHEEPTQDKKNHDLNGAWYDAAFERLEM